MDKLDLIKIKSFLCAKEKKTVKRTKIQATDWEKYLQKIHPLKDCHSYHIKSTIKKQTTQLKSEPKTLTDTVPMKICKWQVSIRKDAPLPMSSNSNNNEVQLGVWQFRTKLDVFLPDNLTIVLLGIYPKEGENVRPHKTLHINVYSSFIHNYQNLKATQISFRRWMGKLCSFQPMEGYPAAKRSGQSGHGKAWRKEKRLLPRERNQSERATSCRIPTR